MWSVSQSPEEFVHRLDSVSSGQENKRQVIREQTSMRQVFYSPETDVETLSKFGLEPGQINTAKNELTPGRGHDHSESLIQTNDYDGWIRTKIETLPLCADKSETTGEQEEDKLSELLEVGGVGRTYGKQLSAEGIETPEDLLATDPGAMLSITTASASEVDHWLESALEITSGETVSKPTPTPEPESEPGSVGEGDAQVDRLPASNRVRQWKHRRHQQNPRPHLPLIRRNRTGQVRRRPGQHHPPSRSKSQMLKELGTSTVSGCRQKG